MSGFRRVQRGKWHTYELDGRKLPGVTTLIRNGVPKPNLVDWAARVSAEYAADHVDEIGGLERDAAVDLIKRAHRRSTNAAAAKGGTIHDLAAQLSGGGDVEVPDALAGYVDAYLAYVDDWAPDVIALERPVVHPKWLYAGTFDELAVLRGHTLPSVVDIKTGGSGVFPEVCLQVAAYRYAEVYLHADGTELPMPRTDGGYALWLGDDGTYELLPLVCDEPMFRYFLHVIHVAAFMGLDRDDVIGLPLAAPAVAS